MTNIKPIVRIQIAAHHFLFSLSLCDEWKRLESILWMFLSHSFPFNFDCFLVCFYAVAVFFCSDNLALHNNRLITDCLKLHSILSMAFIHRVFLFTHRRHPFMTLLPLFLFRSPCFFSPHFFCTIHAKKQYKNDGFTMKQTQTLLRCCYRKTMANEFSCKSMRASQRPYQFF